MDNITHSLIGAALAETGLKRWTPLATATLIIGANLPDLDIVTGAISSLTYLEHHRGITHALVAIVPLAFLLAGLMHFTSRWRRRKKPSQSTAKFLPLFGLSLISICTHPLLDFTNSYGWRPFLPWNRQWYFGDIDFVVDPWLWAVVGGLMMFVTAHSRRRVALWSTAFALPTGAIIVYGGIDWRTKIIWLSLVAGIFILRAVLTPTPPASQRLMQSLIIALLVYFGVLAYLQKTAVSRAREFAQNFLLHEEIVGVDAMPVLATPFQWQIVVSTGDNFYFANLSLLHSALTDVSRIARQSGENDAINSALHEPESQTFLRFARFPVIRVSPAPKQMTQVEISDARFFALTSRSSSSFRVVIYLDQQLRRIVEP